MFSNMTQAATRKCRAPLPKSTDSLLDSITVKNQLVDTAALTRAWINHIPEPPAPSQPKRKALAELANDRVLRTKVSRNPMSTSTRRGGRKGATGESQPQSDQDSRRSSRLSRKRAQEEVHEHRELLILRPSSQSDVSQPAPDASIPPQSLSSEISSPSKNLSRGSRTSSPSKKSARIDGPRLAFYAPSIEFTYYERVKENNLLTDPLRILWRDVITLEDQTGIPIELKVVGFVPSDIQKLTGIGESRKLIRHS